MKKLALFLLSLTCSLAIGQNLVENPSIENTGPCPVVDSVFSGFAEPWTNYFGTPDFFLPQCDAPGNPNLTINEQAFDGNAFAGISVYGDSGTAYIREYLHGELSEPLEKGKYYRVTFYVKPVNEDAVSYGINKMGLALTKKPMDSVPAENIYPFTPQIRSSNLLVNESYWTSICGVYKAKGGEEFITIGNFNDDLSTGVQPLTGATNPFLAYYLVDFVQVVPNDLPELPEDTIICDGQRINLRIDAPDVQVRWEWLNPPTGADNISSTDKNFYINSPGLYRARISDPGCSYTDTLRVEPVNCDECKVYVPDAFTPNGDDENDEFTVIAEEPQIDSEQRCRFETYRINIFDRWGQKVFESASPEIHWDGTNADGDKCAQGIYTYTIEYEYYHLRQTQTLSKRGYLMLIR